MNHTSVAIALAIVCAVIPHDASATPGSGGASALAAQQRTQAHVEGSGRGAEVRSPPGAAAFLPISDDAVLPARFEIRVGAEPLRLLLPDGTALTLAPNSRLSRHGSVDVALGGVGRTAADHLSLAAGEVTVDVPAIAHAGALLISSHEVLVAPLPGASMKARAHTPRRSQGVATPASLGVAVYQGEARFLTRGAWKPLLAGQAVEAFAAQPPPPPVATPPAPVWAASAGACRAPKRGVVSDCSIAITTTNAATAPLTIGWNDSAEAIGYLAEVARDEGFRDIVARREGEGRSWTLDLAPGRYFARVSAESSARVSGLSSVPREIRVARLALPQGTLAREGAWLLPQGREIEIADPGGLEVALGKSGFMRASPRFGLPGSGPAPARLRVAGAPDFVEVRLDRSPLQASIQMSPKNPVWPFDPILVEVRIGGAPVPSTFEPKLVVRIGMNEVPVTWERHGSVFRGRIDPRVPPGPWVVRVEARDAYDNEIGRAFTEVDGPPRP